MRRASARMSATVLRALEERLAWPGAASAALSWTGEAGVLGAASSRRKRISYCAAAWRNLSCARRVPWRSDEYMRRSALLVRTAASVGTAT